MSAPQIVAAALAAVGGVSAVAVDKACPYLKYDLRNIRNGKKFMKAIQKNTTRPIIDHWESHVTQRPNDVFLIFEDSCYTYQMVDQMACKVASVARGWGLKPKDTVAMVIENEPAFIWTFLGLQKLGVAVAWINCHLRSHSLVQVVTVVKPKVVIVGPGDGLLEAFTSVFDELAPLPVHVLGLGSNPAPSGLQSLDPHLCAAPAAQVHPSSRQGLTMADVCCYINTSGTTGVPKAATMAQAKLCAMGSLVTCTGGLTPADRIYATVPLYHSSGGGMCLGGAIISGASLVLRRKFSSRHFWSDVCRYEVTAFQYIGELFRYLVAQPPKPEEKQHKVRFVIGNGLRKDIWHEVNSRFGLTNICEFYGSTEGFTSLWNSDNRPGAVGRISPIMDRVRKDPVILVKFDYATATPIRNKEGRCIKVKIGEPGLLISRVPAERVHNGTVKVYESSKEANEAKLVKDAFVAGDVWFNYGDVLVQDSDCFVYFHDRIGDTFRWKGENVSTTEVANVLGKLPFLQDANVYGVTVPGQDGRAGMAAITAKGGHSLGPPELKQLHDHVVEELPSYAQPRFLRHLRDTAEVTGTFKYRKVNLAKEGFDPATVKDPLYYLDLQAQTYSPLTAQTLPALLKSKL